MAARFVILHHKLKDSEHWDLMLEHEDALLTWQLERPPIGPDSLPIAARRIQEHRRLYLDYEGLISKDRSHVIRIDRGEVTIEESDENRCVFQLVGEQLTGRFAIKEGADGLEFVVF